MCEPRTCGKCPYGNPENIKGNGVTEPKNIYLIRCKFDLRHLKHRQDECDHNDDVEAVELSQEVHNADRTTTGNNP